MGVPPALLCLTEGTTRAGLGGRPQTEQIPVPCFEQMGECLMPDAQSLGGAGDAPFFEF